MLKLFVIAFILLLGMNAHPQTDSTTKPVKIAVIGLVHGHVGWILGRAKGQDVEMVAIVEPDRALAERLSKRYGFPLTMVYATAADMLKAHQPEAVVAFNAIYDHLQTVETFAPLGIHIMVEKPLAVSTAHAEKMAALATKHHVQLMTNYETTWYASNSAAQKMLTEGKATGAINKMVFHTGHQGPKEIGVGPEFLTWLTNPKLNGGGALTDFGCYGANIATWLLQGQQPVSITASTQQLKPQVYPKVEDDATILVQYPATQVIIQASWNWPFSRKDMEVYGQKGYVFCLDGKNMLVMDNGKRLKDTVVAPALPADMADPFRYFAGLVRGTQTMAAHDPSALQNNLTVVRILEAAKRSAATGKRVLWKELYPN